MPMGRLTIHRMTGFFYRVADETEQVPRLEPINPGEDGYVEGGDNTRVMVDPSNGVALMATEHIKWLILQEMIDHPDGSRSEGENFHWRLTSADAVNIAVALLDGLPLAARQEALSRINGVDVFPPSAMKKLTRMQ
jgi:hypothetical protein